MNVTLQLQTQESCAIAEMTVRLHYRFQRGQSINRKDHKEKGKAK